MNSCKSLVFTGLLIASGNVFSGGVALSENDCLDILERWAANPDSVPAHLVNHCRDMLATGGPVSPAGFPIDAASVPQIEPAAGKGTGFSPDENRVGPVSMVNDPCAGPSGSGSIHCWGPWESVAPAAGPIVTALAIPDPDPDVRPEERGISIASPAEGEPGLPVIDLPLGSCEAGQSCGFATTFPGTDITQTTPDDVTVVSYESDPGPTRFVVDPGGNNETVSNSDMAPVYFTNILGQENVVSEVTENGVESKVRGLVLRDDNGEIELSSGNWAHGDVESGLERNSGKYIWGNTVSQGVLDRLNSGQGVSVSYSGSMAGDSNTRASMTVNYGTQPTWSGNWNNATKGYSFDAGGSVSGANFASDNNQFSSNVQSGYVQGAILNNNSSTAVGHAVDVTLDNIGKIKDVGLLRESLTN